MAESAISSILSAITPIVRNEINLLGGVTREIKFISDEFEQMKALLEKTGANEDTDPQFEAWVTEVREIAYDAGDVLEQFVLRLKHRHGGGFSGFLSRSSRFMKTIFVRHQIASEIQRIKLVVQEVSLRKQRYEHLHDVQASSSSNTVPTGEKYDIPHVALLLSENEIVGITGTKTELINWLVDEEFHETRVLSVCGMGGLGKTTLVKKIYDDAQLAKHFEAHAWITVSKSFQIKELLKETIKKLYAEEGAQVPVELEERDSSDLIRCVSDFLQQKRYVIVLDDIWDTFAWEALQRAFPSNNSGSRLILTTRDASLALFARSGKVHNLLPLPIDESRTLFCRKVFQGDSCPLSLEETTETILKKCNGLPLAIVAIGGLLATKGQRIDEWNKISRGLGSELRKGGKLSNLDSVLSLSYFDLPWHLRLCFLYLSIFPEDYSINHWRLIRLWIAEGFVVSTQGQTAEEVAESYLTELTDRSLILIKEVGKNGRAIKYHIHDIWRELIISRSNKHGLVTVYTAEQHNSPRRVRRLSIHYEMDNWQEFKDRATHVYSLLMFGSIDLESLSSILYSLRDGAKLLKVLDMRDQELTTFPRQIGRLLHLKYLSLRGNKEIKEIPKCIGDLRMLETLDLKNTGVQKLPEEILRLHRLRHLLVGDFMFGFKGLKGMERLLCLQKLCSIELNQSNNDDILRSLSKLTRLRKVDIRGLRNKDAKELCSTLEKLTELRSLHISTAIAKRKGPCYFDIVYEIIDLEPLTLAPKFLHTLYVRAMMEKLPKWIASLLNLTKVILTGNKLKEDPLPQLQDLPNLRYLELYDANEGETLCFKASTFKQLTTLVLDELDMLKRVNVMEGAMPLLENLYIYGCRSMEELPSGIETLSSLSLLEFRNIFTDFTEKLEQDLENGNVFQIAHIPIVRVNGMNMRSMTWHGLDNHI